MRHHIDELLFEAIKKQAYAKKLMSREHFSVDGTLLEACASTKSVKPKEGSGDYDDGQNFHGQKRSIKPHEYRLFRKGKANSTIWATC